MSGLAAEYARCQERAGYAVLSARAKFRLTGADRLRYLQGQVTANVAALTPRAVLPACVTTAKGKLCGEVFIAAFASTPDALWLDTDSELREPMFERLGRYIIADDVTLEDVTDRYGLWHIIGPNPSGASVDGGPQNRWRFGLPGLDLWISLREADGSAIPPAEGFLSTELLETLRLEAGLPRWGHELTSETLPPEAGLDRTHIAYDKGCYIGQETISRLRGVGHVNRELRGFVSTSGAPLSAGMKLAAAETPEVVRGQLTSAGWSFALAKPIALGYLKRGSPLENLLALPAGSDAAPLPVQAHPLPFTLP